MGGMHTALYSMGNIIKMTHTMSSMGSMSSFTSKTCAYTYISVCVRARFVKQGSADNSMSMATVEENANRREDPEAADSHQSTIAAGGRGPGPAKATPAPRLPGIDLICVSLTWGILLFHTSVAYSNNGSWYISGPFDGFLLAGLASWTSVRCRCSSYSLECLPSMHSTDARRRSFKRKEFTASLCHGLSL